ncbi:MAG TPA: ABC transporter ATPase [Flavobacterium sp.]|uniref:ABC transporter ATPase n=1 Tax=unclassified Flavobacterium TaxID=196869 RepID=UPI000E86B497|nr:MULTISPECIES: ABC transporter ATPase [unclassified Flavobacterium]HBI00336.1 ABC transporter ATPase [Flavobacterium sp.]HRE78049.1 ABC transporter ATPase [Flavobacterium sp.]
MYIPFENLPEESRIWIYQSNRKFSDEEVAEIENDLQTFVEDWVAHGTSLEASFITKYNRFIILAVNQDVQQATGCSIDKSVEFIQSLEQKYKVDLLDKMNVTYKQGEFLTHKSLLDFKRMAKEKAVSPNTIVFNNLVNTIEEWKESWEVPAEDSWHSRFF